MEGYYIPNDIELKDGYGRPTYIVRTIYRKGDYVTLNYKQIELIANRVNNGELHPFENAPFYNKKIETPGGEMLNRFNNGEIAKVTKTLKGNEIVVFKFDDGFEVAQNYKWLKKLKKVRKLK
jgi:hypothetical protein